jgi:hypothetical protein
MTMQFDHQRLAKSHDFTVAFALGIEIRTALSAAHWQPGQTVLEDLFEAQEFQDAKRHIGVKPHPTLIRADRIIELDAPRAVGANLAIVVFPANTKDDNAVRFRHPFQNVCVVVFGVVQNKRYQRFRNFSHRLMEFRFTWISLDQPSDETVKSMLNCDRHR